LLKRTKVRTIAAPKIRYITTLRVYWGAKLIPRIMPRVPQRKGAKRVVIDWHYLFYIVNSVDLENNPGVHRDFEKYYTGNAGHSKPSIVELDSEMKEFFEPLGTPCTPGRAAGR